MKQYIKFADLNIGLYKNIGLMKTINHKDGGSSSYYCDVVYINKKDKEVIIEIGSSLKLLNEEKFNKLKFEKDNINYD